MTTVGEPQPGAPPPTPHVQAPLPPQPDPTAGASAQVRVGGPLVVAAWTIVVLLVVVVLQLQSVRANQVALQRATDSGAVPVPEPVVGSTAPALDLAPADGEAARRAINDAYRAVFSPGTPPEVWSSLVVAPGDLGPRLAELAGTPCGSAVPVLTSVRFVGDDDAIVDYRFENLLVAEGVQFQGGARREGGTWKVTSETVAEVLDLAAASC